MMDSKVTWSNFGSQTGGISRLSHDRTSQSKKHLFSEACAVRIASKTGKFVARDFFVKGNGKKSLAIIRIGHDFTRRFLYEKGKVENFKTSAFALCYSRLLLTAKDIADDHNEIAIIAELGGEKKAESYLYEVFSLLEEQEDRLSDALLLKGANIFYCRDQYKILRSVSVHFDGHGWCINAYPLRNSQKWPKNSRVFFREHDASAP